MKDIDLFLLFDIKILICIIIGWQWHPRTEYRHLDQCCVRISRLWIKRSFEMSCSQNVCRQQLLSYSFFKFIAPYSHYVVCNAEMAALDSPVFEEKMTRTRTTLLSSVVKKYLKPDELHAKKPVLNLNLKKSPSSATLFN